VLRFAAVPTTSQKVSVALAFVAAALSLTAAAIRFFGNGEVALMPIAGGLFMLALGLGGYLQLKKR
jgi:hypothetical protein